MCDITLTYIQNMYFLNGSTYFGCIIKILYLYYILHMQWESEKKKIAFFFFRRLKCRKVINLLYQPYDLTVKVHFRRVQCDSLSNLYFQNFTQISPLRAPPPSDSCIAYLSISSNAIAHNLCALRISKTQTPLLKILPRFHIYNRPADSCITCVCDIFKCNRAIFMCFLSASRIWWTQSPILKIYADYTSDSHLMIQAPPDLANIIWWKCLLGALKKYKSRVPSTKIHQILPLGVSC